MFARNLTLGLGAELRAQLEVKMVAGEQLPFSEFVKRLAQPMYVCSMRLEPFDAVGLLELNLGVALPMVNVLLGGVGLPCEMRELTDIEEEILTTVVETIVQELNVAWQPVGLRMVLNKREMESHIVRTMSPGEKTLCVGFEIRMQEAQGMLSVCLPSAALNAILRRMVDEGDRPRRRSKEALVRMRELMGDASIGTTLQFAPMRIMAREVASLAPGSLLRLPMASHSDAELRIGGVPVARAHPVSAGEHRGAQLINNAGQRVDSGSQMALPTMTVNN
jgi:flagellar motor switch protein FliM